MAGVTSITVIAVKHRNSTETSNAPVGQSAPHGNQPAQDPTPPKTHPEPTIRNEPKVVIKAPVTQKNEGPCSVNNIGGTVSGIECTTNPPYDPQQPVVSYFWNGGSRTVTPGRISGGSELSDTFNHFAELERNRDWNGLLASATKAKKTTPTWFSSDYFIGEANFKQCQKESALKAVQKFIDETDGDFDYRYGADGAQQMMDMLNSPNYVKDCLRQR